MLGYRFECLATAQGDSDHRHTRGDNKPVFKTCRFCGRVIHVERGLWGLFVWSWNNSYPMANAVTVYTSHARAERRLTKERDKNDLSLVLRWVPESYCT